jgi:hypothetical protein
MKQTKPKFAFLTLVATASLLATISVVGCQKQPATESNSKETVINTGATSLPLVYTDVNPDTNLTTTGMVYNLDLNKDGITDFIFADGRLSCSGKNEVILDPDFDKPAALPSNTLIGSASKIWYDSTGMLLEGSLVSGHGGCPCLGNHVGGCGQCIYYKPLGPWTSVSDAYLGVRVHVGTAIYYGWVHIAVGSTPRFVKAGSSYQFYLRVTIEEYCVNRNSGVSILAGQVK